MFNFLAGNSSGAREGKSSCVNPDSALLYLLVQQRQTDKSAKFQPVMQMHLKDAPLDPSVFLPVFIRIVWCHGLCLSIAFGQNPVGRNSRLLKIILYRLCPALGEGHILAVRTYIVGVAGYLYLDGFVLAQKISQLVELHLRFFIENVF